MWASPGLYEPRGAGGGEDDGQVARILHQGPCVAGRTGVKHAHHCDENITR